MSLASLFQTEIAILCLVIFVLILGLYELHDVIKTRDRAGFSWEHAVSYE